MQPIKLSSAPESRNLSLKTNQPATIVIENISNKVFGKSILCFAVVQCQKNKNSCWLMNEIQARNMMISNFTALN